MEETIYKVTYEDSSSGEIHEEGDFTMKEFKAYVEERNIEREADGQDREEEEEFTLTVKQ
jgi:hypothetical protein